MSVTMHERPGADALDEELASLVAARLEAAVTERGAAVVAVSGGKTPLGFFERLSERELSWGLVSVTLADERWVPPDHPDSNEGAVRRHLLRARAAAARFVPLWSPAETPEAGAGVATERLRTLRQPFDLVILGMGDDGHTASLFPGAPELALALAEDAAPACLAVTPPVAPHRRLTLNRAAILRTRRLVLEVRGAAKRQVLERALTGGPVEELPVRLALQSSVPCDVFWSE